MNFLIKKKTADITIFEDNDLSIVTGTFHGIEVTKKTFKNLNTETINFLQQLNKCIHPNIQRIFKYEVDRDLHYLTLELFSTNLINFITNSKRNVKKVKIVPILNEITKGLQYLHEHGILHKNLNPENVFVDAKKSAKLCNIGINEINEEKVNKKMNKKVFKFNLDLHFRFICRLKYTRIVNIPRKLISFH